MQLINYFFASIISFLGLLIGILLVKIAPEEQKPLGKYFAILRKILLLIIFIFIIFYYFNDYLNLAAAILLFMLLVFIECKIRSLPKKSAMIYSILGVLFFLSSKNTNLFAIESSMVLLYGLPTASLMYSRKERNHHKLAFYNIWFVAVANLLFAVTTFHF